MHLYIYNIVYYIYCTFYRSYNILYIQEKRDERMRWTGKNEKLNEHGRHPSKAEALVAESMVKGDSTRYLFNCSWKEIAIISSILWSWVFRSCSLTCQRSANALGKSPVSGAEWSRFASWFQTTCECLGKLLNLSARNVFVCRMARLIIAPASLDCDEDQMNFSWEKLNSSTWHTAPCWLLVRSRRQRAGITSDYVSLGHRLLQKQT